MASSEFWCLTFTTWCPPDKTHNHSNQTTPHITIHASPPPDNHLIRLPEDPSTRTYYAPTMTASLQKEIFTIHHPLIWWPPFVITLHRSSTHALHTPRSNCYAKKKMADSVSLVIVWPWNWIKRKEWPDEKMAQHNSATKLNNHGTPLPWSIWPPGGQHGAGTNQVFVVENETMFKDAIKQLMVVGGQLRPLHP